MLAQIEGMCMADARQCANYGTTLGIRIRYQRAAAVLVPSLPYHGSIDHESIASYGDFFGETGVAKKWSRDWAGPRPRPHHHDPASFWFWSFIYSSLVTDTCHSATGVRSQYSPRSVGCVCSTDRVISLRNSIAGPHSIRGRILPRPAVLCPST